jgi:hypothetical protein
VLRQESRKRAPEGIQPSCMGRKAPTTQTATPSRTLTRFKRKAHPSPFAAAVVLRTSPLSLIGTRLVA